MTIDERLLAADERARAEALDVTRSFIVQAPAGSGKTELLIQRYLALLGTVAEPEEVVAITFTNKAAAEMRSRVIEALERAHRGDAPDAAHQRRTLEAARSILERDAARDWRLREYPRRLRIQTLDAFCASITRLLPVSSGIGGELATSADAGMQALHREAATATLDWLADGGENAAAVERVLVHLDNAVDRYVEHLARMLAKRDQWIALIGRGQTSDPEAVRAALESDIRGQVSASLVRVRTVMEGLGGRSERELLRYAGLRLEERHGEPQALAALDAEAWPQADPDALDTWRAIAAALITASGSLRRDVNRNQGFPPGDAGEKAAFREWLARLSGEPGLDVLLADAAGLPDTRYPEEQWEALLALFAVLPLAVAELERLFAERGVTDHVEIAQAALAALGSVDEPGELAMLLDYRIRHLLVDEMQDTSLGQYELLSRLTAGWEPGDGRTLFCVGDPMQSVYRFRDAEVGRFVAARERGIGDVRLESLVLRRNFRSGERLVDWFNDVFPGVLPERDDVSSGAIAYSSCVPVETHAGLGHVEVHPLVATDAAGEARCSVGVIERCLAADDGNLAVLVRGRSQLPELLAELRRRGIAYRAIEIDRLTDLPEVIDLLALARALSHDGDRIAWLALLRSPFVALRWADVHALARNDGSSTVPELARDPGRLGALSAAGRARLADFLARLDAAAGAHALRSLRERVERAWFALGGPATLRDPGQLDHVYRFLDALEKLEAGGSLGDVARLEEALDAERVSSPGDEQTRVQVMTMHKAKGLQFDHVVLHALGRRPAAGDRDVLAWLPVTRDDGSGGLIVSPPGPRASEGRDPLYRFIDRAATESDRHEIGRLLYVACTRAVRSLHLVGSVATRADGAELAAPPSTTLLRRLWPAVERDFEQAFSALRPAAEALDNEEPVFADPGLRRLECGPFRLPPAPPARPGALPGAERDVTFEWVGAAARHAGTIVHRWLELMAGGRVPAGRLPPDLEAVSRRWARGLGLGGAVLEDVVDRVAGVIARVVVDPAGRWLLEGDGRSELRLTGLHEGRVVSVAIDRVRIGDDGVHWLVDYKTGTHEGGDLPGFLRQEAARYREQLRRYRDLYAGFADAPLRTALYFPLLGEFLEVDVDAADAL